MKVIELNFKNTIAGLAGFKYGQEVYEKHAEDILGNLENNDKIIIRFPNNIQRIASSFIQGFFSVLIQKYGVTYIKEKINIKSIDERLEKQVMDKIDLIG